MNEQIDATTLECVRRYAHEPDEIISRRLEDLDREFDIERTLQMNASIIALAGIGLGATVDRRWFALPATVLGFLLLHATQGWCPPVPFFRRAGVRTRSEIDRERFVLKFLRGDFEGIDVGDARHSPERLVAAAAR